MLQLTARAGSAHASPRAQRKERTFNFDFPACDKLPPPVLPFIGVSFSYSGKKEEYLCAPTEHAAVRCVLTQPRAVAGMRTSTWASTATAALRWSVPTVRAAACRRLCAALTPLSACWLKSFLDPTRPHPNSPHVFC